jgi:hypothetical protein
MPVMIPRIRIQPPLFWAATKNMLPDQIDALWDRLERFIALGDTKSLQQYDFVVVERLDSAA